MYARARNVRLDVAELVKAPSRQLLSEATRELLYVEQGSSMAKWDPTLTPYIKEPMDCLKSRRYDSVIFAGPARTGKTIGLIDGWIMDTIARDRADMLVVSVSQDKAAEHSKRRLQRAFDASPEIKAALSPLKSDNNIHDIKTRAGSFLKIGWPSKNIFSSSSWKRVALTDYDRFPLDIGGEGNAYTLAAKRTTTFMSSGMVLAESSPGYPVTDPNYRPLTPHEAPPTLGILSLYNLGDRRLFMWQCPSCGEFYQPTFDLLVYDREEPDPAKASKEVLISCPCCGDTFREDQRVEGQAFKIHCNNRGLWLPEGCKLDQNRVMTGERRDTRIASFWQSGPTASFQTWNSLVWKIKAARRVFDETGDSNDLQAVTNVDLGLPFAPPRTTETSVDALMARREDMGVKMVPSWVRFLIATVDVQGGKGRHFVVQVHGFGPGLEVAIVDRFKIEKSRRENPEKPGSFVRVHPGQFAEDFDLLTEKVIMRSYEVEGANGKRLGVYRVGCDSAGEEGVTAQAYDYYRRLKKVGLHKRFILLKGASGYTGPLVEVKKPDNATRGNRKAKTYGEIPILFIHPSRMKDIAAACISREIPGPRYLHLPNWLSESVCAEFLAEERDALGKWNKISQRNEAFDLLNYAWAIIHHIKAERITDWENPPLYAQTLDMNPEAVAADGGEVEITLPKRRRRASS